MPLFVAEIGLNHEGNSHLAFELIRQAATAGADIVKFQFGWKSDPGELNHLSLEQASELKSACDDHRVEMMASVFNEAGFRMAKELRMRRYKIASRTVVDDPGLCRAVLAEGAETLISLGMWEQDEWPFGPPDGRIRYLYCRSVYPTRPQDIADMPDVFSDSHYSGYSDHSLGIGACIVALARGAKVIEKHFTLNKTSRTTRDHILSATPQEFRMLTEVGRETAVSAAGIRRHLR